MAPQRKRVPANTEDEILFLSNHTCCICTIPYKDVQIHHIDGNPANDDPSNLAVVCLDCHSRITGKRGLGQAFKPGEVRKYKPSWEARTRAIRGAHQTVTAPRQKALVTQIDLIVCDILASRKNNPRAEELLDLLYELNLWRGSPQVTQSILEGLHHLATMTGLGSPQLSGKVAETLWKICWHFVGPDRVSMGKRDLRLVLECVDALRALAEFKSLSGHGRRSTAVIAEQLENYFLVGLWYKKQKITSAVTKAYEEAIRECYTDNKLDFDAGRMTFRRSIRKSRQALVKERPNWRLQRTRLTELLEI